MSGVEQANRALKRLARSVQHVPMFTGKVAEVHTSKWTCDVDPSDGGARHFDVRLKVAVNEQDKGAYSVPKVGSLVLVGMLDGQDNALFVIAVETIEEHVIHVDGGGEVRVKPNGVITLNGEQYGGLVKVQELRNDVLLRVNTWLTGIRNAIASGTITPGDGGAAFKISLIGALQSLQLPDYSNIESTKTKHGSL